MTTDIINQGLIQQACTLMPELDRRYKRLFDLARKANQGLEVSEIELLLAQSDLRSILAVMTGEAISYANEPAF